MTYPLLHSMPISPVSTVLSRVLVYAVIAVFSLTMVQRRFLAVGERKRFATLFMGLGLTLWLGVTLAFVRFAVPDPWLLVPLAATIAAGILFRSHLFPYRLRCSRCGARLPLRRILFYDAPRCDSCSTAEPGDRDAPA